MSDISDIFFALLTIDIQLADIGAYAGYEQKNHCVEKKDQRNFMQKTFRRFDLTLLSMIHSECVPFKL